jgi:DNA-binding beta-propeller fold protein YncE
MQKLRVWMGVAVLAAVLAGMGATAVPGKAIGGAYSKYKLKEKIVLGGEGFWDYLIFDESAKRVFITRGTRVVVLDPATGKVAGEIPNLHGIHGVALAPKLGRGFVTNGDTATVTIFDLKTLAVIGEAPTGDHPDAIVYDEFSGRVFAMNGRGQSATAINAQTGKVEGTVPLGGKPEFVAADGKGHIYMNLEDKNEQAEVDTKAMKLNRTWPLAGCESPSALSMDRETRRLFAGCGNKTLVMVDAEAGKVLASAPIGDGVDSGGFDPSTKLVFSSNGDGTLTVLREDSSSKLAVVQNIETQKGARTMALDTKTGDVYLVTAEFGPRPAATPENPRPRPAIAKDSFVVLVYGR